MAHHNQFSFIARVDGVMMWLNLLFLLMIGLIPFVTSVMSEHATPPPTMLYAAVLFSTSVLLGAIWGYARRDPVLMEADVPASERRQGLVTPLLVALVFALSIPVAYVWGSAAGQWTWLLALPAGRVAAMLK
jgi:uncharacterized membrane protein